MEYFKANPLRDIPTAEIVDWAVQECERQTGKKFRDPDRMIRQLAQQGHLMKLSNGWYRYDPDNVVIRELEDFPPAVKKQVLERDNYSCVICGMGLKNNIDVYVDHIIAKDMGGRGTLENGQTLCGVHNNQKKNYGRTESAKRLFIQWYDTAKELEDIANSQFFADILKVYEKHNVNGQIKWKE
jgi:hypothetical protein